MKGEEIYSRRNKMIVLDVQLDNFYAFKDFHMNLTYPKRIVGSTIKNEHLPLRPNFRYKKVNVFFGANASGKTTFGRILMKIFNFIEKRNYEYITDAICDRERVASFVLDLASNKNVFYRVICFIEPSEDGKIMPNQVKLQVLKQRIQTRDSYETCVKRIEDVPFVPADNYLEELEKMESLAWLFDYPNDDFNHVVNLPNKDEKFCAVCENVLKSLDPSIQRVKISQDVDDAYVVVLKDRSIVLQNGMPLDNGLLSSGTKAGVAVANLLYSLMQGRNSFYYCDEKFSYIHSDIEKAILSVMIDFVGPYDQLFFTTHNTDILDMSLPKHTFTLMRKDVSNEEMPITCIEASSLLKRSTDSLRNAIENDLFSTAPALELIYSIAELDSEE